jgi:hypothetical protein
MADVFAGYSCGRHIFKPTLVLRVQRQEGCRTRVTVGRYLDDYEGVEAKLLEIRNQVAGNRDRLPLVSRSPGGRLRSGRNEHDEA